MNKRFYLITFMALLGAQLAAPAIVASGVSPSSRGFFGNLVEKIGKQWDEENRLLEPVYQQSPLHWHARNVAYLSMGILGAFATYRILKWGLSKIGLIQR